jgi:hypothetical protein
MNIAKGYEVGAPGTISRDEAVLSFSLILNDDPNENRYPMYKYTLTIKCECLNEAGILVARTLKTAASTLPRVADNYVFLVNRHCKPIVIRIMKVISPDTDMEVLICDGEEVDDVDNIREVIERTAFVLD